MRAIATGLTPNTTLCISLSGRPGITGTRFHNWLYDALGLGPDPGSWTRGIQQLLEEAR